MNAAARLPSGNPQDGKSDNARDHPLRTAAGRTLLAHATAGRIQVVYEREGDKVRIAVMRLNEEGDARADAQPWVLEGAVITGTPASSDRDRVEVVCSHQAARLAAAFERGDDELEAIDAFLADVADLRDPFITRGTRRRHGE